MGKIKQMADSLANQIAAGEVIERPASVVKELVENAVDAGSQDITVELKEAGIQQVRVIDDGSGMDKDDLLLAFTPHATSKIYELPDLSKILTLGFRGEALASIASVAKVRVESMTLDQTEAHFIEIAGSKVVDQGIAKSRQGTMITVDSLFYNTPARLKHLKTLQTELKHIIQFVQNIALSFPSIRFTLTNNGQKLFSTVGNGDLRQAIAHVYQPAVARQLLQIEAEDTDFKLSGYISPPTLTRTSKDYLHWIINGRAVRSFMLDKMLTKTYGRQLMVGRYPISVIQIELDPQLVDVNVHPTKQSVRLSKETELNALLKEAVKQALNQANPVPTVEESDLPQTRTGNINQSKVEEVPLNFSVNRQNQPLSRQASQPTGPDERDGSHYNSLANALNQTTYRGNPALPQADTSESTTEVNSQEGHSQNQVNQMNKTNTDADASSENVPHGVDFSRLRYVGQIHGTYLIAESEHGFYLIDQHAAQERIRYEQFMAYDPEVTNQQQLLMPLIFQFTPAEMADIESIDSLLQNLGIHLEAFGPTSFQLQSYPNWINADEVEKVVYDLTELLIDQPDLTIAKIKEQSIIMQSCRGAIKANHYLDKKQALALIQAMQDLEDPYHCPHGRPVFVEFTETTLEKLFKRIQDPHEGGVAR